MKQSVWWGVVFFLTLVRFSFAKEPVPSPPSAPSPEAYRHVLLGLQYEDAEDLSRALEEYRKALSYDPDAPFLFGQMGKTLAALGNLEEASGYLEKSEADTETLNLLAQIYTSLGKDEKRIAIYEALIAKTPGDISGYLAVARFRIAQNDFQGAIEVLSRGIAADPEAYLGPYYLAKLFVHEKAYDKGIEQYQKALALYPAFELAHLELADLYETSGQSEAAIKVYQNVLAQQNIEHKEAGLRLAHRLMEKENFAEAESLLQRLMAEKPDDPDIWLKISLLRAEQKEYAKAEEAVAKVLSVWPHATDLTVYLASLYEMEGQYEKALNAYQAALNAGGDPYNIRIRRGFLYLYRFKKTADALAEGERAKAIYPDKPEVYLLIGQALYESKRFEEAASAFEKGITLAPDQPDFHFHLGATYDKLNRFEPLVAQMEKALALDATYAAALNYLGYTYADRGIHLDQAVDLIQRALLTHPDEGYYVDSLGWAYYKQGKAKEALSLLKKAADLVPDDPVILEHLGEIYLMENQRDAAYAAWIRSLELDTENEKLKIRFQNAGFTPSPVTPEETSPNAH